MTKSRHSLLAELSKSLTAQNYHPTVVANHLRYAGKFLDHLATRDIPVAAVTPSQVEEYSRYAVRCFRRRHNRAPCRAWHNLSQISICRLLRLAKGTWPPEQEMSDPVAASRQAICHAYEGWMREERGLAEATIDARLREARRFLDWYFGRKGADGLPVLGVRDIDLYMDMRAHGLRRTSLGASAAWLRSLLGYLYRSGRVPTDLAPHVIGPMLYAYEHLPSILDRDQIDAVLKTTAADRSPRGLRDHAILQLLALYGLREGEIVGLRLDDIDWRTDTLRIRHTKTDACSYMPLLTPAGDAILDYLRLGRPQVESRDVFLRSLAPYIRMKNLHGMIGRRLAAADVTPAGKRGAHVFRHARAVELLRASVPQKIIGDVLGHRSIRSTDAYLRLATEDLRAVALELPGSAVHS